MTPETGSAMSRRAALAFGARAAAMSALAVAGATLAGCGDMPELLASGVDHTSLVLTLGNSLIPFTATPGASMADNAAFVLRAVESGLMRVPANLLDRLADELSHRSGGTFVSDPPARQARVVACMDADTFAAKVPAERPWFAVKALILISYYTSEGGMTSELRYELAPGRYDSDIIIDSSFRPLSNDWSAVSVKKKLGRDE